MAVDVEEVCTENFMLTDGRPRQLHVRRFFSGRHGPVTVLWHGLAENGEVFYPHNRGLAIELAVQGFDVFVVDGRGKGRSWPSVAESDRCSTYTTLNEDLLQLCEFITMECGVIPHVWVGHGAGAPLVGSALSRFPRLRASTVGWVGIAPDFTGLASSVDYVGSKVLLPCLGKIPSGIVGPEAEWGGLFADACRWKSSRRWIDPVDGMDYLDVWNHYRFPPAIMFAGSHDAIASPSQVLAWVQSLKRQEAPVMVCRGAPNGRMMLQSPYWTKRISNTICEWFTHKQQMRANNDEEEKYFNPSVQTSQKTRSHYSAAVTV